MITVTRYRHGRYWAVLDRRGELVCVCVYLKGAHEVARRLSSRPVAAAHPRRVRKEGHR